MNEFAPECQAANRIAAQLRGRQPLTTQVRLKVAPIRVTGIAGKGAYLRVRKEAKLREVLAFCHEFYAEQDQLPTLSFVAERFGVIVQTAQDYMGLLCKAGHIERNVAGRWRFKRQEKQA